MSGMEMRPFGSRGLTASLVGQGTWYLDNAHRATAVATLQAGIEAGMTHVDTAEMYGDAELVVAEAIAGRRDDVFLVSKVLPQNASRAGTLAACERSLRRLGTDRLDCYLLHWRGSHPLGETVAALAELQDAGKILSWGVSNFDVSDLQDLLTVARASAVACNQVLYHLGERAIEHEVIPFCEKRGITVVAYSPYGHGDFPRPNTLGGRVLAEIAGAHGATARQAALAFLTRRPAVIAVPKASNPDHATENAGAGTLRLSEAEIARIDETFPRGPRPRFLPML